MNQKNQFDLSISCLCSITLKQLDDLFTVKEVIA